ncbi:MAG TPA: hypothetical protein DEF68_09525 [Elusimicrobia bacterium]|nr:hypothetical protein [Elusimicrobiota bacterium]
MIYPERRFCFGSNGVVRAGHIIPNRQVGKGREGAENGRIKTPSNKIALRAIDFYSRNPGNGLVEIKSMGALKRGRGYG